MMGDGMTQAQMAMHYPHHDGRRHDTGTDDSQALPADDGQGHDDATRPSCDSASAGLPLQRRLVRRDAVGVRSLVRRDAIT